MIQRAVLIVDGSNFYHGLVNADIRSFGLIDYAKLSKQLVGEREWVRTTYYVGQVSQLDAKRYADQRRFLSRLAAADRRVQVKTRKLVQRPGKSECAAALLKYVNELRTEIPTQVRNDLLQLGRDHTKAKRWVEKGIDVLIAMDIVTAAQSKEADVIYVLSADADLVPAVEAARRYGAKVFCVHPSPGYELKQASDATIVLKQERFDQCYADS